MENTKIFTDIPDVDREILLRIPDDTNLLKACSISIYSQKLCNEYFWKQRFIIKYNVDLDQDVKTKSQINYRQLYRKLMGKSKYEILTYGAKKGYLELVKEIIRKGANIRADYYEALIEAAKNGHLEIVKYLIKKGANIHAYDDEPLRDAAGNGHLEVVKYLIEKGANINADYDLALMLAAKNGYLEVVKYLIENGAHIHTLHGSALIEAALKGHLEVVKHLI